VLVWIGQNVHYLSELLSSDVGRARCCVPLRFVTRVVLIVAPVALFLVKGTNRFKQSENALLLLNDFLSL
jgi:hypothetical protein